MGYSTLLDVKQLLALEEEDTEFDVRLREHIKSADGIIDAKLAAQSLSVGSPVPQNIIDASKRYAAWLFRREVDPAGLETFKLEADFFVETHITSVPGATGVDMVIGQDES